MKPHTALGNRTRLQAAIPLHDGAVDELLHGLAMIRKKISPLRVRGIGLRSRFQ